jgi:hypothetical protein
VSSQFADVVRTALEGRVEALGNLLVFWTFIVAVGLFLEAWSELLGGLAKRASYRRRSIAWWVPWYSKAGLILVIAGVAGELYIEGRIPTAEGQLREHNNAVNLRLQQEAGDAKTSADQAGVAASRARGEVAGVQKVAEELRTDLLKQGPRAALLQDRERRRRFVNSLLPFAGQKFTVNKCGDPSDHELHLVTFMLTLILEKDAKWPNSMRSLTWIDQGSSCGSSGVIVSVEPNASPATRNSGKALVDALRKLPFEFVSLDDTGQLLRVSALSKRVPFDTETVLITVFEHPYMPERKTSTQPSKAKR